MTGLFGPVYSSSPSLEAVALGLVDQMKRALGVGIFVLLLLVLPTGLLRVDAPPAAAGVTTPWNVSRGTVPRAANARSCAAHSPMPMSCLPAPRPACR